jgi:hypothetical protein
MAVLLVQNLSKRFAREVVLQPVSVTSKMRISMIVKNLIDVEMGASTYTKEREDVADLRLKEYFSTIFYHMEEDWWKE